MGVGLWVGAQALGVVWESLAENSGIFASSDGIVRGCTNHTLNKL
jgi:hypothetical protein